ncbi:MAG: hypothetical protein J1F20_05945 [Muribaculaceae bacterium]|nr:hypothetical protein [Muribaculaceae bacterium]
MKKNLKYIFCLLIGSAMLTAVSSCTNEVLDVALPGESYTFDSEGYLHLSTTLEIPAMSKVMSRANTLGEAPDYDNLQLYAMVFEDGAGLKQYTKVETERHATDDKHNHNELITFEITLEPTEKNAVIHLVATNQPDFEQQILTGFEDRVISSLYTDDNNEAYWQRIELGGYIPSIENTIKDNAHYRSDAEEMAENVKTKLTHVPMVRNFCRVSVNADNVPTDKFKLTGIYVFNTVDRGSVAPYVAANAEGQRFVNYFKEDATTSAYEPLGYNEIVAQNHVGTLPAGEKLINKTGEDITTKSVDENGNVAPVYFYERPARSNSPERTFVIVGGKYYDTTKEKFIDTYYKVDLGRISETEIGKEAGIFEYYNLLRNFDYKVNILEVESEGYPSIEDAARGVVFNNFSAAIEVSNMFSISDGKDMISVNHLTFVFTQPNQIIDLEAQYRYNIDNGTGGQIDNDNIHISVEDGDVIESISQPGVKFTGEDNTEWIRFQVKGKDPDDFLREQLVYVYRGQKTDGTYGLYRILHFYSHKPWPFTNLGIFPGVWRNPDEYPNWEWERDERDIGQNKGSNLTVFFELPNALPQAIFPLKFVIESERQNIQNAYHGNAVVQSVPYDKSLFYEEGAASNPTTSRIQYVKTVTWEEYYGGLSEENLGKSNYIVRCPFLTITDLSQDGVGADDGTSTTRVRIKNDYFGWYDENTGQWKMYEDSFFRDSNTSDPSPRNWDFSLLYWDNMLFEMDKRHDRTNPDYQSIWNVAYTADNNVTDALTFVDGGNQSLNSGTDGAGHRYVQTTNANDKMMTSLMYNTGKERDLRLVVTSTDNSGNRTAPRIVITGKAQNEATVTVPTPTTGTPSNDGYPTPYVYLIRVPADVTGFNIEIMPTGTQMRFYQVEMFPRWDSFENAIQ